MEIKTCQECNAFAPTHHPGCPVGCAVVAEMAAEDRALRRREVEAQERLALATQLHALTTFTDEWTPGLLTSTIEFQVMEVIRRLNALTPSTAPMIDEAEK